MSDNRVFLGLRGPVLRGWTVVIELEVAEQSSGCLGAERDWAHLDAVLRRRLPAARRPRRADLVVDGQDLPLCRRSLTMDLDGPVFIYRWSNALEQRGDSLTFGEKTLKRLVSVPFGVWDRSCRSAHARARGWVAGILARDD